ncbi:hypothetical protein [Ruminococcus sp.]
MNENLHDIRRKFPFLEVLWKIRRISRHRTPGIPRNKTGGFSYDVVW